MYFLISRPDHGIFILHNVSTPDIPLLPAIGTMTKGNTSNFVVNWLNNKELQFTLAAETILQMGRDLRTDVATAEANHIEEDNPNTSLDQDTLSDDGV